MEETPCTHPAEMRSTITDTAPCSPDHRRCVEVTRKTVCTGCHRVLGVVVHYPERW